MTTETGSIPPELTAFFRNPGGHSLILKGHAGTGKTTLTLQLLELLGATTSGFYLSTRVADESLYRQFPWMKDMVKKNPKVKVVSGDGKTVVSERLYEDPTGNITLDVGTRQKKQQGKSRRTRVDREELKKLEGRIEMGDAGITGRHGELEGNTITFDLGSDLPEVDTIYDTVEGWMPQRALVVVDSVDALSEKYGIGSSHLITTLQKDLVENSLTNLVFVLESGQETAMDYLGDGVVMLSSGYHEGRRIRILTLEKLRGAEIKHPRYLYTLTGGKLHAFGFTYASRPREARKWEYVPDRSEEYASSGNEDLDDLMGSGIPKGAIIAIEVGANVPYQYTDMIKTAFVCNYAAQKRGVIIIPSMKATAEVVREVMMPHLGRDVFDQCVRIYEATSKVFDVSILETPSTQKLTLPMDGSDVESELKWSNIEYGLSKAKKPFLSLVGFDTLESVYGPNVIENMTDHITAIRKGGHAFVGFLRPTTNSTQKLVSMAHIHLKVESIDGAVVVYGQKPFTELYFLSFNIEPGFPKAILTPIV